MPSKNLDKFYSLTEKERQIVKSAVKSGDSAMTRQVLHLYFPTLTPEEIIQILPELRALG